MRKTPDEPPLLPMPAIAAAADQPAVGLYSRYTGGYYVLEWRSNLGYGRETMKRGELYRTRDLQKFLRVAKVALSRFRQPRAHEILRSTGS